MAYIVRFGQTPPLGVIAQDVDVSGWAFNSGEFGKIKLPNSFTVTAHARQVPDNEPFPVILAPDHWDTFEAIKGLAFVVERNTQERTAKITVYPDDSLYGRLNEKLPDYADPATITRDGMISGKFASGGTNWSVELVTGDIIWGVPVFSLFGLKIAANGTVTKWITPEGAEVVYNDYSVNFELDCAASLPDKTVGEILYIAAYLGGYVPNVSFPSKPKEFGAKWWGKNLTSAPAAEYTALINGASDNYFVEIPLVTGARAALSAHVRKDFFLWVSFEAPNTLPPSTGFVNYFRGLDFGGIPNSGGGTGWEWWGDLRKRGGHVVYNGMEGANGEKGQGFVENLGGTYRYYFALPWQHNGYELNRLMLYYNAQSASPMPSAAVRVTRVMVNAGPFPMPYTEAVLDVADYQTADPFALDYASPLDIEAEMPDISELVIKDEVHQASKGYAKFGSGWTDPLLGWSKTGRSAEETIATIGVNGSVTTANYFTDGKPPSGLVILPRPDPRTSLPFAARFALSKGARKVSFSSLQRLDPLRAYPLLRGVCTLSSAKMADRMRWQYEGYYYPSPAPQLLTTQKLTFLPTGGTKPVMAIGDIGLGGGGTKTYDVASVSIAAAKTMGGVAYAEVTAAPRMPDFGAWLKKWLARPGVVNPLDIVDYSAAPPTFRLSMAEYTKSQSFSLTLADDAGAITAEVLGCVRHDEHISAVNTATFALTLTSACPFCWVQNSATVTTGAAKPKLTINGNAVDYKSQLYVVPYLGTALTSDEAAKMTRGYTPVRMSSPRLTITATNATAYTESVDLFVTWFSLPIEI